MNNHVASGLRRFAVHNNSDVRYASSQVPGDKVPRGVILSTDADRQRLSLAAKEHHQIRDSAVIDIRIRAGQQPSPVAWVVCEIPYHVFMNFFLQVDTQNPVRTDDFIGANPGIRWDIPARIGNTNVGRIVPDRMVRPLDRRSDQFSEKFLVRIRIRRSNLRLCRQKTYCKDCRHRELSPR